MLKLFNLHTIWYIFIVCQHTFFSFDPGSNPVSCVAFSCHVCLVSFLCPSASLTYTSLPSCLEINSVPLTATIFLTFSLLKSQLKLHFLWEVFPHPNDMLSLTYYHPCSNNGDMKIYGKYCLSTTHYSVTFCQ